MSYDDSIMDFKADAANGIAMEGYLYKRASNAFKTWSRYEFTQQTSQPEQPLLLAPPQNEGFNQRFNFLFLLQTLVFNSKKSAGVSEEIQGEVLILSLTRFI